MLTTQNDAAFTALAAATSAAIGYTIAWTGGAAPAGAPNSMINTTWTVDDSTAAAVEFQASYDDLDTTSDINHVTAIVQRALGMDGYGGVLQTNFAAAAVNVAAAAAPPHSAHPWS
jgi:hypothetical protein